MRIRQITSKRTLPAERRKEGKELVNWCAGYGDYITSDMSFELFTGYSEFNRNLSSDEQKKYKKKKM